MSMFADSAERCVPIKRVHFFPKKKCAGEIRHGKTIWQCFFYAAFFWGGGNSQSRTALGNNCSKSAKNCKLDIMSSIPRLQRCCCCVSLEDGVAVRITGFPKQSKNIKINLLSNRRFSLSLFLLCMPSPPWAWSPASSCCSSPPSGHRQLGSPSQ